MEWRSGYARFAWLQIGASARPLPSLRRNRQIGELTSGVNRRRWALVLVGLLRHGYASLVKTEIEVRGRRFPATV